MVSVSNQSIVEMANAGGAAVPCADGCGTLQLAWDSLLLLAVCRVMPYLACPLSVLAMLH
jgi:hypothetical protein